MSNLSQARITIIIPTLATEERFPQLLRAVSSVIDDAGARAARVLVCANGPRADPVLLARLRDLDRVSVVTLTKPSLTNAIAHGRALVDTEFFGYLDDDDELLPGGLALRLALLEANPEFDFVVSNGLRRIDTTDTPMLADNFDIVANPLDALFKQNWLASCGGLFRNASVSASYFTDCHDYAEWTWLAYSLSIEGRKFGYLPASTFIINDTAGSRSKSAAYRMSYLALCERMLQKNPPKSIRIKIGRRLGAALHDMSDEMLKMGNLSAALRFHLRSLATPGGLQYLSYSRHVLKKMVGRSLD